MFLYLGDIYNNGSYSEFINYYEPTFGRLKDITNPTPGDHEGGRQFQGYRDYWDSNQHYYAVAAGKWRLFGLDSTERFGETAQGTGQYEWLKQQLESVENTSCTVVFMDTSTTINDGPRWTVAATPTRAVRHSLLSARAGTIL
jgi:hypothetical protein